MVAVDAAPKPTEGAYAVTALDAAGNESGLSNSAYLNASLLPVSRLQVAQIGTALPKLSWAAPNGNVTTYKVYADAGPDRAKIALTPAPVTQLAYTDAGYNGGDRLYTVATVDANGVEMARSLLLPDATATITEGLPLERGVMNLLQVQVANRSSKPLNNLRAVVRVPTNKDSSQFKDHLSQPVTLEAGQARLLPVVVGGYDGLPDIALAQVRVDIIPNEGELASIAKDQEVEVTEGGLVVGMATYEFTRGATGKLKLTIENTTETEIELLTATQNGQAESTDLRFEILDADGNVLATQPYKQTLGANVVSLTNGKTVARIPAGASYVSDEFLLDIPAASPTDIRVRLVVDRLRYHTGQDDEVVITGRGSEKAVSLVDTAYYGEVTGASPESSFGDQDITITGRALDRTGNKPLPNSRLKLVLNQQGFERLFSVTTDSAGNFTYTFKPTFTDSGLYKVSAVHPDVSDRPEQKAFTINRVTVGPSPYKLEVPKNYPFTIPLQAKSGPGSVATNLKLVLDGASHAAGQLPAGITAQAPPPVNLASRQAVNVPVAFTANNDAQPSGSLTFNVLSDEHPGTPIGQVKVDYNLTEAKPFLVAAPSFIETGLAVGGSQVESVKLQNKGLKEVQGLAFGLQKAEGGPPPSWASVLSQSPGTLAVGAQQAVDLAFSPPEGTAEGVYKYKLAITGDNIAPQSLNVFVSVTQSGKGSVLFKAADIYTATLGKNGQLIQGLAGSTITVQNEDVLTVTQELATDSLGEAFFKDLPTGRYKFRATAPNHQELGGRLQVKPGITLNQPVFLQYNLITVEWSVKEITIQDRYDIVLNATFETDVPAPVVVIQPASVNLPKMGVGDVFYGELTLTNFGLVRADHVTQQLPGSDGYFRYEFLVDVPDTLAAKQRLTIPYRVVALQSLDATAASGTASGGGCYNYGKDYRLNYDYECANGTTSTGQAATHWFSASNSSCPVGGGGSGGVGGGGYSFPGLSGGGGGGGGGSGGGMTMPNTPHCKETPKGKSCPVQ